MRCFVTDLLQCAVESKNNIAMRYGVDFWRQLISGCYGADILWGAVDQFIAMCGGGVLILGMVAPTCCRVLWR